MRPHSDPLDSLAHDVHRMIEHDAVADLWDRYNRGDRNVLARGKLYTGEGQRAFEDIRRKLPRRPRVHAHG